MKTKNLPLLFLSMIMTLACNNNKRLPSIPVEFPVTDTDTVNDMYFGEIVPDPYRWLEDDLSEKTADWVEEQNNVTFSYLQKIPFRKTVRDRLGKLLDYERYSIPLKKKDKFYYYKNSGLQNHAVLYVTDNLEKEGEVLLDPNTFSADGTTALTGIKFSDDCSLLAFTISEGGSDWEKLIVIDPETKEIIGDTITDIKFSGITWDKNEGFLYSSYDNPKQGSVLSGITESHKVYYHKIGTPQKDDILIFGGAKLKRRYLDAYKFEKSDYLFISAAESTSGNELYFRKGVNSRQTFKPIIEGFQNDNFIVYAKDNYFYIWTYLEAPNGRLVKATVQNPTPSGWEVVVPERDNAIQDISTAGGDIFISYLKDASSYVVQYDLEGNLIREVEFQGIGSAEGFSGEDEDAETFYSFETFTSPNTIYSLDIQTGESMVSKKPELQVPTDKYVTEQVFYTSKDGTKIPMFIVHNKELILDGNNPTLLYGYGGFNISYPPFFSTRNLAWLDMGGVFALANLRGGGEYGEEWHQAGTQFKKQNVFDDFIAAAEYLQDNGYTSNEKLTIMGGSNGGLLVGATITQRPDLMQVALPAVGVMDMLRYHKFTAGAGWISDYGCADSTKAMFEYLKAYSPVHNIRKGIDYPATLVTTADHDDRVVPAHSYKFIANLQAKQSGDLPVLIRIDVKAGHGSGKSTEMVLDELADQFSFAFYNMNEYPLYYQE